jgi:uncharacterized membrane protein YgcG
MRPHAVPFWDAMLFRPYGGHKDVVYFAVVPTTGEIWTAAEAYVAELSSVYAGCNLGEHQPGEVERGGGATAAAAAADGEGAHAVPGFVPVHMDSGDVVDMNGLADDELSSDGEGDGEGDDEVDSDGSGGCTAKDGGDRTALYYEDACQRVARAIDMHEAGVAGAATASDTACWGPQHVELTYVVYIVGPFMDPDVREQRKLDRCACGLREAVAPAARVKTVTHVLTAADVLEMGCPPVDSTPLPSVRSTAFAVFLQANNTSAAPLLPTLRGPAIPAVQQTHTHPRQRSSTDADARSNVGGSGGGGGGVGGSGCGGITEAAAVLALHLPPLANDRGEGSSAGGGGRRRASEGRLGSVAAGTHLPTLSDGGGASASAAVASAASAEMRGPLYVLATGYATSEPLWFVSDGARMSRRLPDTVVHVAYQLDPSPKRRWLCATWTDAHGTFVKSATFQAGSEAEIAPSSLHDPHAAAATADGATTADGTASSSVGGFGQQGLGGEGGASRIAQMFRQLWASTARRSEADAARWRSVVCKRGFIYPFEAKLWEALFAEHPQSADAYTPGFAGGSLVSVEHETELQLYFPEPPIKPKPSSPTAKTERAASADPHRHALADPALAAASRVEGATEAEVATPSALLPSTSVTRVLVPAPTTVSQPCDDRAAPLATALIHTTPPSLADWASSQPGLRPSSEMLQSHTLCVSLVVHPAVARAAEGAVAAATGSNRARGGARGLNGSDAGSGSIQHPLDTACPRTAVRFVAEQLHALSWLTVDPSSHQHRRSRLPLHLAVLVPLVHRVTVAHGLLTDTAW